MNQQEFQEVYENALKDPSLYSTVDIDRLLNAVDKPSNDYLENKTMNEITEDVFDQLTQIGMNDAATIQRLLEYRFVDEIHELHKGKHVRWIRCAGNPLRLTNGGIVADIKFLDNGVHVLCMNSQKRFIQYKFDDCLTFQKLGVEELFILASSTPSS